MSATSNFGLDVPGDANFVLPPAEGFAFMVNVDAPSSVLLSTARNRAERLQDLMNVFLHWEAPFDVSPKEVASICIAPVYELLALIKALDLKSQEGRA